MLPVVAILAIISMPALLLICPAWLAIGLRKRLKQRWIVGEQKQCQRISEILFAVVMVFGQASVLVVMVLHLNISNVIDYTRSMSPLATPSNWSSFPFDSLLPLGKSILRDQSVVFLLCY